MSHNKPWITSPQVILRTSAASVAVWIGIVIAFNSWGFGEYLVAKLARPLEFRVREWLGKSPEISSQLKIFAVDDSTFGRLGTWVLSSQEWIEVLSALAKKSPKAIFIDQIFSKGSDFIPGSPTTFTNALQDLGVPIYVGAFLSPGKIKYRDELPLKRPEYALDSWLDPAAGDVALQDLPPLPSGKDLYPYGPSSEVRAAFTGIGHLMYDSSGTLSPLVNLGRKQVLPHLATFMARDRRLRSGRLELDGVVIPLDEKGRQIVNFPSIQELRNHSFSLHGLLAKAKQGGQSDLVEKGDIVLILPHMYTGNTDFKSTPLGTMPAGWIVASQLNSFMERKWLKPVGGELFFTAILAALGALMGATFGVAGFWIALHSVLLFACFGSLLAFSYFSTVIPWLLPTIAYLGSALTVYASKALATERKTRILRQAFEGVVPASELKEVLKHPHRVSLEPRERVVTVMFVDVVGFSLIAERMLPRNAFENLKAMLAGISQIVHEYGGAIDKTLGDGLLCYFGYRFDQDTTSPDHAEKALLCACKIQELNIHRNIQAAENGDPVYPLRIGINTSSCYLGDLGSENRIDFTLVGNGVNFAKRLEGACEMHAVLMGATTYDLVRVLQLPDHHFVKRLIQIKHHNELVEAYEYDPFAEQPQLRAQAIQGFRKCVSIERIELRRSVPTSANIYVMSEFGQGRLMNFSQRGLALRLSQFLAKGTRIRFSLDTPGGALKRQLELAGIEVLIGEVRWGYADDDQFVHGLSLDYLSEEQGRQFLQILIEFAFLSHQLSLDGESQGEGQHVA